MADTPPITTRIEVVGSPESVAAIEEMVRAITDSIDAGATRVVTAIESIASLMQQSSTQILASGEAAAQGINLVGAAAEASIPKVAEATAATQAYAASQQELATLSANAAAQMGFAAPEAGRFPENLANDIITPAQLTRNFKVSSPAELQAAIRAGQMTEAEAIEIGLGSWVGNAKAAGGVASTVQIDESPTALGDTSEATEFATFNVQRDYIDPSQQKYQQDAYRAMQAREAAEFATFNVPLEDELRKSARHPGFAAATDVEGAGQQAMRDELNQARLGSDLGEDFAHPMGELEEDLSIGGGESLAAGAGAAITGIMRPMALIYAGIKLVENVSKEWDRYSEIDSLAQDIQSNPANALMDLRKDQTQITGNQEQFFGIPAQLQQNISRWTGIDLGDPDRDQQDITDALSFQQGIARREQINVAADKANLAGSTGIGRAALENQLQYKESVYKDSQLPPGDQQEAFDNDELRRSNTAAEIGGKLQDQLAAAKAESSKYDGTQFDRERKEADDRLAKENREISELTRAMWSKGATPQEFGFSDTASEDAYTQARLDAAQKSHDDDYKKTAEEQIQQHDENAQNMLNETERKSNEAFQSDQAISRKDFGLQRDAQELNAKSLSYSGDRFGSEIASTNANADYAENNAGLSRAGLQRKEGELTPQLVDAVLSGDSEKVLDIEKQLVDLKKQESQVTEDISNIEKSRQDTLSSIAKAQQENTAAMQSQTMINVGESSGDPGLTALGRYEQLRQEIQKEVAATPDRGQARQDAVDLGKSQIQAFEEENNKPSWNNSAQWFFSEESHKNLSSAAHYQPINTGLVHAERERLDTYNKETDRLVDHHLISPEDLAKRGIVQQRLDEKIRHDEGGTNLQSDAASRLRAQENADIKSLGQPGNKLSDLSSADLQSIIANALKSAGQVIGVIRG